VVEVVGGRQAEMGGTVRNIGGENLLDNNQVCTNVGGRGLMLG
jgi:hypothetical protein